MVMNICVAHCYLKIHSLEPASDATQMCSLEKTSRLFCTWALLRAQITVIGAFSQFLLIMSWYQQSILNNYKQNMGNTCVMKLSNLPFTDGYLHL